MDPCSNEHSMVRAKTTYTVKENGLAQTWRGHRLVFMNPPHSTSPNNIEPWMQKAHEEFLVTPPSRYDQTVDQFVGLIPGKPDTAWFHDYVTRFSVRCFLRGRPKYWQHGKEMPGPGKFPSILVYEGRSPSLFMQAFEPYGWLV